MYDSKAFNVYVAASTNTNRVLPCLTWIILLNGTWQHIHFSVFVERERCDADCNQSIALTYIGNLILPLFPRHIVEYSLESIAANAKSVLSSVSVIHLSINENVEHNHIVCVCVACGVIGHYTWRGRYEYVCSSTTQYIHKSNAL